MFKQFIHSLQGDEVYMLLSLFIFLAFFIGATIAMLRMKKSHLEYMSDIPLNQENVESN
ncbi:MAG: hypothetical protein KKE39_02060 [Bacteroidetes bacterium]|nr:hypothetical protein [Bacteroidota bacterium]MBU1372483.1 hypothetical protein [Bacteroidota bacterium]MBU1485108.1 hypothetical protein [Bacteroidota bacterium]MBU1761505.1 hypothetical protein [Bacteroidota bacterium]MBU2045115.1 hypothetical protein [Bacteroidota bacterium]